METMENIFSRKSIRNFTGEKISEKDLETILRATDTAPVGRSRYDSLHITIVEKSKLLDDIDKHAAKVFGDPNLKPLYGAPTLIIISSLKEEETLRNAQFSNAAIMVHIMALVAVELGVGHCDIWGTIQVMRPDLISQLNLPEGFIPCCGIALGITPAKYKIRNFPKDRITKNFVR